MPRIVLDAVAEAHLLDHLEVEHRPLVQPLRFEHLAVALEIGAPLLPAPALIVTTASFKRSRPVTKCDFG